MRTSTFVTALFMAIVLAASASADPDWRGARAARKNPARTPASPVDASFLCVGEFHTRENITEDRTAIIKFMINKDGNVIDVAVEQSSGLSDFDGAMEECVKHWLYMPAKDHGQAIEVPDHATFVLTSKPRPAPPPLMIRSTPCPGLCGQLQTVLAARASDFSELKGTKMFGSTWTATVNPPNMTCTLEAAEDESFAMSDFSCQMQAVHTREQGAAAFEEIQQALQEAVPALVWFQDGRSGPITTLYAGLTARELFIKLTWSPNMGAGLDISSHFYALQMSVPIVPYSVHPAPTNGTP
jgi:TonB family protein